MAICSYDDLLAWPSALMSILDKTPFISLVLPDAILGRLCINYKLIVYNQSYLAIRGCRAAYAVHGIEVDSVAVHSISTCGISNIPKAFPGKECGFLLVEGSLPKPSTNHNDGWYVRHPGASMC